MKLDPKVTIMIPTYNQEKYILDAVESALKQTYANLEVIVGDDASKDNTQKLLSKIKDTRFKYVRNTTNLGRACNYKNILYNQASGDYVVNLDGDDYYTDKCFIEKAVKLLVSNETVMVVARAITKSDIEESVSQLPNESSISGLELLKCLPKKEYFFMHMAVMYDRKKALLLDFYRDACSSSDWESLFRLGLRGEIKYLNRNIGVWRIHDDNETSKVNVDSIFSSFSIWREIYQDAIVFGMKPSAAKLQEAKVIASFIPFSAARVSTGEPISLLMFLLRLGLEYPKALLFAALSADGSRTLIKAVLGYFRREEKAVKDDEK